MAKKRVHESTDKSTSNTPRKRRAAAAATSNKNDSSIVTLADIVVGPSKSTNRVRLAKKAKSKYAPETPDLILSPSTPTASLASAPSKSKCQITKRRAPLMDQDDKGPNDTNDKHVVVPKCLVMPSMNEDNEENSTENESVSLILKENNNELEKVIDGTNSQKHSTLSPASSAYLPAQAKTKKILIQIRILLLSLWFLFMVISPSARAILKHCVTSASVGWCIPQQLWRAQPQLQLQPSNMTLQEFLQYDEGYYIAMGPAFFGFYAYFGALSALDEANLLLLSKIKRRTVGLGVGVHKILNRNKQGKVQGYVNGVVGASAGAMAAVMVANGKRPVAAADFACSVKLSDFADPPGFFGTFKGYQFESIMTDFLSSNTLVGDNNSSSPNILKTVSHNMKSVIRHGSNAAAGFVSHKFDFNHTNMSLNNERLLSKEGVIFPSNYSNSDSLADIRSDDKIDVEVQMVPLLENSLIPVAITTFDLLRMKTKILTRGNSAKASRASSTFPGLFQPVLWYDDEQENLSLLIDGGVQDTKGLLGLTGLNKGSRVKKRVLHIALSGSSEDTSMAVDNSEDFVRLGIESIVTVKLTNIPKSGPLSMAKGPNIVELARLAMNRALDETLMTDCKGSHVVHVDASTLL